MVYGSGVQGQLELHSKFEACQDSIRLGLKRKKEERKHFFFSSLQLVHSSHMEQNA